MIVLQFDWQFGLRCKKLLIQKVKFRAFGFLGEMTER